LGKAVVELVVFASRGGLGSSFSAVAFTCIKRKPCLTQLSAQHACLMALLPPFLLSLQGDIQGPHSMEQFQTWMRFLRWAGIP
jgi:hypothetical protein